MWEGLVILCEMIFPCVRVLRLADRNEPAFDRLYYFVLRAKDAMLFHDEKLEECAYFNDDVDAVDDETIQSLIGEFEEQADEHGDCEGEGEWDVRNDPVGRLVVDKEDADRFIDIAAFDVDEDGERVVETTPFDEMSVAKAAKYCWNVSRWRIVLCRIEPHAEY